MTDKSTINKQIAARIFKQYCETPNANWYGFNHLNEYNRRKNIYVSDQIHEYKGAAERLLGWIPLNPSKKKCRLAIESTYTSYLQGRSLPSQEASRKLLDIILEDRQSLIFIKGNRGVGKTAALNNFFNEYYQILRNNNLAFFRCDARKIEKVDKALQSMTVPLNISKPRHVDGVSLKEYVDAHNIYVALVHSRNDPLLENFQVRVIGDSDDISIKGKFGEYLETHVSHCQGAIQLWTDIVAEFSASAKIRNGSLVFGDMIAFIANIIYYLIRPSKQKNILINHFYNFLEQRSHNGTILTIDGVDNFSRVESEGSCYYLNLLKQLKTYVTHDKDAHFKKVIISLRPESYHELMREIAGGFAYSYSKSEFEVTRPDIKVLFQKRINAATEASVNTESFFRFSYTTSKTNALYATFLSEIIPFLEVYTLGFTNKDKLSPLISRRTSNVEDKPIGVDDVLELLFASNVRSMLRSIVGTYAHCREYFNKFVDIQVYPNFIEWAKTRPSIVFEGSLLLGWQILSNDGAHTGPLRRGQWCPPIFSYPIDFEEKKEETDLKSIDHWYGLGLIRVLQFIDHYSTSSQRQCIEKLGELGYSKSISKWFFGRALRYGLISVDESEVADNYIPFKLTPKGAFALQNVLSEEAFIYYLGTASKYPRNITLEQEKLTLHHDVLGNDRNFTDAVLSIGTSIFRCIIDAHNKETANIPEDLSYFALPDMDPVLKQWARRLKILHDITEKYEFSSTSMLVDSFLESYKKQKV